MGFAPRYLAAKKSIDDRALNHHVWQTLCQTLPQTTGGEPLHILEIGAGIGTMIERMVEWNLLNGPVTYLATDSDPGQLGAAKQYLAQWTKRRGYALSWSTDACGHLRTARVDISLRLETVSAEELAGGLTVSNPFHLMIAHAVLDLVDFSVLLPRLLPHLTDSGLAYFTCNFDGETIFLPETEDDREIIDLYHGSMETRLSGASHTGRRLLTFLQDSGLDLMAAGSSDWLIHPRGPGYSDDEVFFLQAIIDNMARELAQKITPPERLAAWANLRQRQVEAGTLSFLARHLDFLARRRPSLP